MEQNEILQQVIETIRKDIIKDKKFLQSVLSEIELKEKNIPPELIISMMNKLNVQNQPPRKAISNAPKDIKGSQVAKPISVGEGSIEAKIVSDLLDGNNVYLMGKAGTGKTYLAKAIAESVMGQPVFLINCSQWTSPVEIRGGQTIKGYEEGQLIKAWAEGGILILDELPKLDPNTAGLLNDALAEVASQPKYDQEGKVIEKTIPYIVNGRGDKIYKGQDTKDPNLKFRFCVIGTGNTDMMNIGNKYGGNQRQDYSLVDRFAGSFYTIEKDIFREMELTYPYVFNVCNSIRNFLESRDALQSISLRTMLNFNRTFEQEMLYKIDSKFADEIFNNDGQRVAPKTIEDSVTSFLNMLEKNIRTDIENDQEFRESISERAKTEAEERFSVQFMKKYHLNPRTGDVLTEQQIAELDNK
jgi:cobaltochelatase CobS